MRRHLVCLTLDTDPDGLSGASTDRRTLKWEGLEHARGLPDALADRVGRVPVTWFIRADGQLRNILGSTTYLLEEFSSLWEAARARGDELAWHPHLYRQLKTEDEPVIITSPAEAAEELEGLWSELRSSFPATAFRNGEGWHLPATYACVERLGFRSDSTAIPGRCGSPGHPMDWRGTPNQPYFPDRADLRRAGPCRDMLELPMNSWTFAAPYDAAPKTRYMNPAVHPELFARALRDWENTLAALLQELCVWVLILHPDELWPARAPDLLYACSIEAVCSNLMNLAATLTRAGDTLEWTTVSQAASRWTARG